MKLRWAAPCLLVLALGALVPAALSAQTTSPPPTQPPRQRPASGGLEQNYPNPFNPETQIPFTVGDYPTCSDPSRTHRVTLKVYNLLAQQVAVPTLFASEGGMAGGRPIENVLLTCRPQQEPYTAYWNGKYQNSNRDVASGIYIARLEIDGRLAKDGVRKMLVTK